MGNVGFIGLGIMGADGGPSVGRAQVFLHSRSGVPSLTEGRRPRLCRQEVVQRPTSSSLFPIAPDVERCSAMASQAGSGGRIVVDMSSIYHSRPRIRAEDQGARLRVSRRAGIRHGRSARRPRITIMVGGSEATLRSKPLFELMGRTSAGQRQRRRTNDEVANRSSSRFDRSSRQALLYAAKAGADPRRCARR